MKVEGRVSFTLVPCDCPPHDISLESMRSCAAKRHDHLPCFEFAMQSLAGIMDAYDKITTEHPEWEEM